MIQILEMTQSDKSVGGMQVEIPGLARIFSTKMQGRSGDYRLAISAAAVAQGDVCAGVKRFNIEGHGDLVNVPMFQSDICMIAAQQQRGDFRAGQGLLGRWQQRYQVNVSTAA